MLFFEFSIASRVFCGDVKRVEPNRPTWQWQHEDGRPKRVSQTSHRWSSARDAWPDAYGNSFTDSPRLRSPRSRGATRLVHLARSGRLTRRAKSRMPATCEIHGLSHIAVGLLFVAVDLTRAIGLDACHVCYPCAPPTDCAWPNQITAPHHPDLMWLGSNGNKVQNLKLYVISIKSIY